MYVVDKDYCMSSYLALRYVEDDYKLFKEGLLHPVYRPMSPEKLHVCETAEQIDQLIRQLLEGKINDGKPTAMFLSGGMDSGILASYMPAGMKAYTARCKAPNAIDETERAKKIADYNHLEHVIVDVTWEDYMRHSEALMKKRGAPIHANEPQVYTLLCKAKEDGIERIIFGDNADMAFGGMDKLLAKDWTFDEWVERYTYVDPAKVLKNPVDMRCVYEKYRVGENGIDFIKFLNEPFSTSSTGSYTNPFDLSGIERFDPYAFMRMEKFDLERIRSGDSKYLIRQLYKMRYPDFEPYPKIAMARAMDAWMADWQGPTRPEFLPNCICGMNGEQKWQIFNLEWFLNMIE